MLLGRAEPRLGMASCSCPGRGGSSGSPAPLTQHSGAQALFAGVVTLCTAFTWPGCPHSPLKSPPPSFGVPKMNKTAWLHPHVPDITSFLLFVGCTFYGIGLSFSFVGDRASKAAESNVQSGSLIMEFKN